MRRALILTVSGLTLAPFFTDDAAAQRRGGFHAARVGAVGAGRPAIARAGISGQRFAGAGVVRPGWQGSPGWGWRAASVQRPAWNRPAWGPGWGGSTWQSGWQPGWSGGSRWAWHRPGWGWNRPGWGWGAAGVGFAAGVAATSPWGWSSWGNDCPMVRQRVWDGFGYSVRWVNSCYGW